MSRAVTSRLISLAKLRTRRGEIIALARLHGASNVRVFGSVARGEARPTSDVDVLVEMEHGRSLLDLGALSMELSALLGCEVDVVTPESLREGVREHVVAEARAL